MSNTITRIEASNSLADLASRIRSAHRDVSNSLARSIERAFDAGDLLIEAKRQLNKHGDWLPWLRDHVKISERTAQRYMRLTNHRAAIEANTTALSDLGIEGALALLTTPSTAVKVVAAAEAAEVIQDKAEAARREVLKEAFKQNVEAVEAIGKRLLPDFKPGRNAERFLDEDFEFTGGNPDWDKFCNDLRKEGLEVIREYNLAVECGNHTGAFARASWLHDLSIDLRAMCEEIASSAARKIEARP